MYISLYSLLKNFKNGRWLSGSEYILHNHENKSQDPTLQAGCHAKAYNSNSEASEHIFSSILTYLSL